MGIWGVTAAWFLGGFVWLPYALDDLHARVRLWQWGYGVTGLLTMGLLWQYGDAPRIGPFLLSLLVIALADSHRQSIRVVDLWGLTAAALWAIVWSVVWLKLGVVTLIILGLLGLKWGLFRVYGRHAFGGADIWVIALMLLVLNGASAIVAMYTAVILSGVLGLLLLMVRRLTRQSTLPFIPFLALGTVIATMATDGIMVWYMGWIY
jgi:prepilin signal peptidase PulO-like enzyme (type II secretory pathway)